MASVLVLFVQRSKLCHMAHSKETPKIYFHVYGAKSSPHNQNWYAHRSIVSHGKCSFPNVFLILWKIEVESPIFFHDKYDLNCASSHLNIYKATFLFDSWALWPPEIWHCIFMSNQVSQYVLWDHLTRGPYGSLHPATIPNQADPSYCGNLVWQSSTVLQLK